MTVVFDVFYDTFFDSYGVPAPLEEAVTLAQRRALIEAVDLHRSASLHLVDSNDTFVMDLTEDYKGGSVRRANFADIHGTSDLLIARDLQWGSARLQPFVTLSSELEGLTKTYSMGIYVPGIPKKPIGRTPVVWSVKGSDKLVLLQTQMGRAVTLAKGESYLDFLVALLGDLGHTKVRFDFPAATWAKAAANARNWAPDTTALRIANDVLDAVGGRGCWADRDGWYCSEPYRSPSERTPDWYYDADDVITTIVGPERTFGADYFDAFNRWVRIRSNPLAGTPIDGDGRAERINQSDGPTSVDARGGWIRTDTQTVDVADQAALEALADEAMEAGKRVANELTMPTGINPEHWHFTVVEVVDRELGPTARYQEGSWEMPLPPAIATMAHELKAA